VRDAEDESLDVADAGAAAAVAADDDEDDDDVCVSRPAPLVIDIRVLYRELSSPIYTYEADATELDDSIVELSHVGVVG